ncbi:36479_t:CDS:2 [Racocetra persica]|uniref:36479_t:CDS:1 n=1 Tax=Racocetra persica TaxID=160502 RepID=A0ACA9MFF5_9GLOM|nr:36479_t:CDS:2 [Racocetra persica]
METFYCDKEYIDRLMRVLRIKQDIKRILKYRNEVESFLPDTYDQAKEIALRVEVELKDEKNKETNIVNAMDGKKLNESRNEMVTCPS